VGEALSAIRDRKLYRATHGTFEDYCRVKWGMSASRARQLCGAAEVAASVTTVTLSSERQARELARVPAPQRQLVVEKAVAATGGKITASAIRGLPRAHVGAIRFPVAKSRREVRSPTKRAKHRNSQQPRIGPRSNATWGSYAPFLPSLVGRGLLFGESDQWKS
jgi:hypothetical protein